MLYLHGMGHFHPDNVIDNAFLESLDIGVDSSWVLDRVGIVERRTVLPLDYIRHTRNADPRAAAECSEYNNADTAMKAAHMAMARAGIEPGQIGMVIAGGCSPQYSIPAESCRIAAALGIGGLAFDVHTACSSFITQCYLLNHMAPEALPDFILLVQPENNTRIVNYSDRRTAVLWGDATSAAIVSARVPAATRIEHCVLSGESGGWEKVTIAAGGHFQQQGTAVQHFAIRKSIETIGKLRAYGEGGSPLSTFIGHQANRAMLEAVCQRSAITPDRHRFNVDRYGNGGAAGAPSVLSQNWDTLPAGRSAMAVVGSGLTWGGLLLNRTSD